MRSFVTLVFFAGMSLVAQAQSALSSPNSDAFARSILLMALDNISRALCDNGQKCAPATPQEKENPPLELFEADLIIRRALISGVADRCGLDWKSQNFLPMMRYARVTLKKNERQMAIIGVMHGIAMEIGRQIEEIACDAELQTKLTFTP